MSDDPEKIVGHKTFFDEKKGYYHEPLTAAEAGEIVKACEAAKAKRSADMPDGKAALEVMFQAYQRLRELGWSEASYCPKDGSTFNVIEAGSTGIHRCHYEGEWPKGTYWVHGDGDLWPSRPILFKRDPQKEAEYRAKLEDAGRKFREERNVKA